MAQFPTSELDIEASFAQVREARDEAPLRPMPLVVITAGIVDPAELAAFFPPGWPIEVMPQVHRELQADLAGLVPNGRQVIAERSGHYVHQAEPELVVAAIQQVVEAARDRRDRTYDPALADLFVEHGRAWLAEIAGIEPWDAVIALEPEPQRVLSEEELDNALTVAADFIDLKSPYMGGHSRRCAALAADAARVLGLGEDAVATIRRAALVHDSARPSCRTRSGTSPGSSRARSSTASSCTRC
jgi:hypothetical protein